MSEVKRRLEEDRQLRNTARQIIVSQFLKVREGVSGRKLGEHLAERVSDRILDGADRSRDLARQSVPLLSVAAGLLALWFAREPLSRLLRNSEASAESDEAEATDQPPMQGES